MLLHSVLVSVRSFDTVETLGRCGARSELSFAVLKKKKKLIESLNQILIKLTEKVRQTHILPRETFTHYELFHSQHSPSAPSLIWYCLRFAFCPARGQSVPRVQNEFGSVL